jgi:hypothetical protein
MPSNNQISIIWSCVFLVVPIFILRFHASIEFLVGTFVGRSYGY